MKRLIYLLFTVFALAACQPDKDGGGGNQTTATTPLQLNCINGTSNCNTNAYGYYQGFQPYNFPYINGYGYGYNYGFNYNNVFINQGFCGCPHGYLPTYNGTMGLGCIQQNLIYDNPPGQLFYWSYTNGYTYGYIWSYVPAAPQVATNFPQYSNIPSAPNSFGSCSQNLTRSCILSQANSCDTGATCRQVIAGSNLGVCVKN